VLVHGSGLSRAVWRGLGYIRALRAEFRVVAIDMRGHGRSGKPHTPSSYEMPIVVEDVLAVLDAAGISTAHYFGYSFGARVGFSLIDNHPERVLSFVSAGGTYRPIGSSIADVFFPGYAQALAEGGMPEFVRQWNLARATPVDPQTTAALLVNDAEALRAFLLQSATEGGIPEDRLRMLITPALLLAGSEDVDRYRDSQRAAMLMPNATFVGLPGRDHGSTLRPADEALAAVLPFLRSNS
jgi:pimeloyl-ACP methyl ester carboxylesterase